MWNKVSEEMVQEMKGRSTSRISTRSWKCVYMTVSGGIVGRSVRARFVNRLRWSSSMCEVSIGLDVLRSISGDGNAMDLDDDNARNVVPLVVHQLTSIVIWRSNITNEDGKSMRSRKVNCIAGLFGTPRHLYTQTPRTNETR